MLAKGAYMAENRAVRQYIVFMLNYVTFLRSLAMISFFNYIILFF